MSAPHRLQVRNLPIRQTVTEAAENWAVRVRTVLSEGNSRPLRDLYQGEYWTIAKPLEDFTDILVASAGLGLGGLNSHGVGYAATFSPGAPDSILRFESDGKNPRAEWWSVLRRRGLGTPLQSFSLNEVVLVAVSKPYQEALAHDLATLAKAGHRVIVLSGSPGIGVLRDIPGIDHIMTGQWLRMVLGGSTPCVGIRFAAHLLEVGSWSSSTQARSALLGLERKYRHSRTSKLPSFNRVPKDDAQVKDWIQTHLRRDVDRTSKSALLAAYRGAGFACEQKRFGRLYDEVLGR